MGSLKFNLFDFLHKKVSTAPMVFGYSEDVAKVVAFRELATQIAISYISNTISKCEFKTFEEGNEVHNELYYALNVNPNPNQSSTEFLHKLINTLYREGKTLVIPHENHLYVADGYAEEIKPLSENLFANVTIEEKQMKKKYKAGEVFHFRMDNRNITGYLNSTYDLYGSLLNSTAKSYKNKNGQKYKLRLENIQSGTPEFKEFYDRTIKEPIEKLLKDDDNIYIENSNMKLEDISNSGGSNVGTSDIIALRKEIFDVSAQTYKIPLPMMYGNITNMNEIVNVWLTTCIDPLADFLSEELTRKTADFVSWKKGNYVKVDTTCVNHIDIIDIANNIDKLISCGFACIDELRKTCGWSELNNDFSKTHFLTKNYESIDSATHILN